MLIIGPNGSTNKKYKRYYEVSIRAKNGCEREIEIETNENSLHHEVIGANSNNRFTFNLIVFLLLFIHDARIMLSECFFLPVFLKLERKSLFSFDGVGRT